MIASVNISIPQGKLRSPWMGLPIPGDRPLTGIPETGLLDMVRIILSKPGPLTDTDRRELEQINQEITDRDKLGEREARREQYKVRRLRQKIKEKIK
jgi:hypothetical protein